MAKTPRKTGARKIGTEDTASKASEPQAAYLTKATRRARSTGRRRTGYDAKRYTGMLPGIAERMKQYLKHMRDDR